MVGERRNRVGFEHVEGDNFELGSVYHRGQQQLNGSRGLAGAVERDEESVQATRACLAVGGTTITGLSIVWISASAYCRPHGPVREPSTADDDGADVLSRSRSCDLGDRVAVTTRSVTSSAALHPRPSGRHRRR